MSNVLEMNPLAEAECELAEYFESAGARVGFRAVNPNPDRFGGVFDENASARLHLSHLRGHYRDAVDSARFVELTLGAMDPPTHRTLLLAFARRGYPYRTELGAVRLWQAFRREGSNVNLLGLVLETRVVFEAYLQESLRTGVASFNAESQAELLAFIEATADRAWERWDAKRSPGTEAKANDTAWMAWVPRWMRVARHAADKRLISALRAYEDVRRVRLAWEREERRRRERQIREARLDRLVLLAGGRHG